MNKKFFFFDIDGTLTDRNTGKIVPSAALALQKLRDAGHFVALATGRAQYKARPFFEANGFDNMVCSGGNGIVMDKKIIENIPLDFDQARALYDEVLAAGYGALVAEDDSKKVYTRNFDFYDQVGGRREPTTYIIDEAYDPGKRGVIYKMYLSVPEGEENRLPILKKMGWLRFEPEYIIIQPDAKQKGILRMLELSGGSPKDTVVFGDDTNDLVMFLDDFYKVAMGNGCDALKARADEVAPANVEDGIYKVCEKNGWMEPVGGR
ncbi:MAG: HAD family hydrolase [Eubacteriaceae bacterium]|jgi:Cof subfamily protein (haloacid dehalogenase superfamily)|nr:HAD family hydrolase [Eubacteriaceae bacterium]